MKLNHENIKPIGGYLIDKPDIRNYSFGAIFGVGEYPRKFTRELPPINIPYQGQIPSCVACSFTFLNEYKSFINDKNNLNLAWRYPFAKTGPYNAGRNLADVAKFLQNSGQPQDQFCADDIRLPEQEFMNPTISNAGIEDAGKRIIGNHWWIRPDNQAEICAAVVKEPIVITLGGVSKDWVKPYDEIITATPGAGADWYHAIVLWDYDLDAGYFRIVNWWGDGLRKLSIIYPLTSALSFADIPDDKSKTMFKIIKTATKQDNWLIAGNTRLRIPDSETFHYFKGVLGIIGDPIIVSDQEINQYIVGEMLPSVKLTRALGGIAKDIYFEE